MGELAQVSGLLGSSARPACDLLCHLGEPFPVLGSESPSLRFGQWVGWILSALLAGARHLEPVARYKVWIWGCWHQRTPTPISAEAGAGPLLPTMKMCPHRRVCYA